eukprot:11432150-Alexandrium_andersonii.AAC.1
MGADRGVQMLTAAPDTTAHNVAVFSNAMSGRQVIHTLFQFQDRSPGQAQREAMAGITSIAWGSDDYRGIHQFYVAWQSRAWR